MLVGHLAPVGPIAAAVARRWDSKWSPWTRTLPWVGAAAGCVFPDLDVISNVLLNGRLLHLYYLPHSVLPYLPLLFLGWLLVRSRRARPAGWTVVAFSLGVLSHLALDVVSHGTVLFYPLWNGLVGWTFPWTGGHVLQAYFQSPNFWLEPGVLLAAALWWLRRCSYTWRRLRSSPLRRVTPRRLSTLPRHEGSREIMSVDATAQAHIPGTRVRFERLDRSRYPG
jgi:hypothetical protein